tara:strand:- start:287 stop:601 length:315 start_codon:yes stop_codon:yes gene_type:complete
MKDFLKHKIIKRNLTWKEIRAEIVKDFMYLTEVQRNEFADVWEDFTSTEDFKLRKMKKDRSDDPRLYKSVEDYVVENALKQIEKDKKKIRLINGKPVKWKPKNK